MLVVVLGLHFCLDIALRHDPIRNRKCTVDWFGVLFLVREVLVLVLVLVPVAWQGCYEVNAGLGLESTNLSGVMPASGH